MRFSDRDPRMPPSGRSQSIDAPGAPIGGIAVPPAFWSDLAEQPLAALAVKAGAVCDPPGGLVLTCLNEDIRLDLSLRCIQRRGGDHRWQRAHDPLLELMLLAYLLNVGSEGLAGRQVGVSDLSGAHFFQGPHALRTDHLLGRYGTDPQAFLAAGSALGGSPVDRGAADVAIRLMALPKVPLYYLLWEADDEFPAAMSVLFDASIERHLRADAIWGLVTYVSEALLYA